MPDDHDTSPSTANALTNSSRAGELVAFADCELIGITSTMTLVINRRNGNQQMMTTQVVDGLKTCTTFKTIAAHAEYLVSTRAELQGNLDMATAALNSLNDAGMLLKAAEINTQLSPAAPRQLPPTRAFVITCDRPAAVERLLESLLRTKKLSQHEALFLIDDSRDPANREANREAVSRFNLRSAKDMYYVGAEAQHTLISQLIDTLPEHAAGISFLLDQSVWQGKKTYGRSRTLCLLMSVGYRALVMDDDILCEALQPPLRESGVGIGSGGMRKAGFYASDTQLLQSAVPAGFDPLSGHASLLGSTLGQALTDTNNGPLRETQLLDTNAALMNILLADSPILVTQSGTLGDPGTSGAHWAVYQGEDTIERLIAAPHGLSNALENRLNWLGSTRPCFYKMPFMSQLTGLDNSQLLPPYFPAFRGEDGFFGAMLVAMHPNSMALEYPFSVPHLPMEPRAANMQEPIASNGDLSLFSRYLTANIDYRDAPDPEFNLRGIADVALRLAARSDADLLLDFRAELAKVHAHQLHLLQNQASRSEQLQCAQWTQYLRRCIAEVQQAVGQAHSPKALPGVPTEATEAELLAEFRAMARGFAAALNGWVEMRSVARRLSQELIDSRALLPG